MNKEQEQQLVSIVSLANLQIQQFEKERNGQRNVILLVGMTGSGKSTIFNFLIGAQFKPREGSQPFKFDLEYNSDQYSVMKEGCNSVTKVPKCYYSQQYKTLIVDFPGFNDTNGKVDEIVIQSLFNKIASKSHLKIVLVNNQPQEPLPKRGADLQDFLNQVLKNETVNMDKITLMMNKFSKQIEDEEIISIWQESIEGKFKKKVGKILIQRAIKKSEDIKLYFSDQQRDKIWKEIIETPQVQLEPFKFKNGTLINNYLIESINLILCQTFQELDSKLSLLTDLNLQQLEGLIQSYNNILRIIKDSTLQNLSNWMNNYLKSLQQISKALNFQSQLKYNAQDFLSVYQFFLDFSNELEGYGLIKTVLESILKSCEITLQNLNNTYQNQKTLQKEIQEKQEEIQKRKQAEEETKKVKNELQQTQRDLSKTQENLKRESEEKNKAILAKNKAQEDQKKAEKETETVQQELSETEKQIKQANENMSQIRQDIEKTEVQMKQGKVEIEQTDQLINQLKTKLEETQKKKKENDLLIISEQNKTKLAKDDLGQIQNQLKIISKQVADQEIELNTYQKILNAQNEKAESLYQNDLQEYKNNLKYTKQSFQDQIEYYKGEDAKIDLKKTQQAEDLQNDLEQYKTQQIAENQKKRDNLKTVEDTIATKDEELKTEQEKFQSQQKLLLRLPTKIQQKQELINKQKEELNKIKQEKQKAQAAAAAKEKERIELEK